MSDEQPVEARVGWWLPSEAAEEWPDAVHLPAPALARLLGVAYEQCAPRARIADPGTGLWRRWTDGDPVPERLREAQLQQARAVWTFERTGGGDMIGGDGQTLRVYPMGWQVEQLLFPDEAVGMIG